MAQVRQHLPYMNFYRFCQLLEQSQTDAPVPGSGWLIRQEPVRFRPHPGMGFPSSEIRGIEDPEPEHSHLPPTVRVNFMGLYGVESPLPTHYIDDIAQRRDGCEATRDFLDIFNHRLITQYYRIWRKYSYPATYQAGGADIHISFNTLVIRQQAFMHWIGERIAAALPETKPVRKWQRPFLKWAGGKYSLLSELDRLIPEGKRLIEPFVGGGSVFLNSDKHECFLLADVNPDLINLYQMLAVVPEKVTDEARLLFALLNTEEGYLAVRDDFNSQRLAGPERAAAFLFLNRHCFNGLIRYNRASEFNVGWGKYSAPYFPEAEIEAFASMAHNCVFLNAGYCRTLALAGEGDVIYCDPPYEPMPGTAGFTSYAAGGFTWDDQVALTKSCIAAHQRGARVVISNSTAPRVIELYAQHGFTLHEVSARRSISSKGSTRETAKDIVAIL